MKQFGPITIIIPTFSLAFEIVFISDLKEQFGKYVDDKRCRLLDETAERALDRVKEGEVDIGQLVDKWTNAFTQVYSMPKVDRVRQFRKTNYKSYAALFFSWLLLFRL